MKRMFAVIVVLCMFFAFFGCNTKDYKKDAYSAQKFAFGTGAVSRYNYTSYTEDIASYNGIDITATAAAVLVDCDGKIVKCKIDSMDVYGIDFTVFGAFVDWPIPRMISADRMQSEILAHIDEKFYNMKFNAFYELIDLGDPSLTISRKEELAARYPISKEMPVYVLTADIVTREFAELSWILKTYAPNYTYDERAYDHEQMQYKGEVLDINSKRDFGDAYGMKGYSEKEWYEHADAFESVCIGKDIDEVKALVFGNGDELINAGCTIDVNDFVLAVEEAYENAVPSELTKEDDIDIGIFAYIGMPFDEETGRVSCVDFDICIAGAATDRFGKTVNVSTSAAEISLPIMETVDTDAVYEAVFNRGAESFNADCVGKTLDELEAFLNDSSESGLIKAVIKAVK